MTVNSNTLGHRTSSSLSTISRSSRLSHELGATHSTQENSGLSQSPYLSESEGSFYSLESGPENLSADVLFSNSYQDRNSQGTPSNAPLRLGTQDTHSRSSLRFANALIPSSTSAVFATPNALNSTSTYTLHSYNTARESSETEDVLRDDVTEHMIPNEREDRGSTEDDDANTEGGTEEEEDGDDDELEDENTVEYAPNEFHENFLAPPGASSGNIITSGTTTTEDGSAPFHTPHTNDLSVHPDTRQEGNQNNTNVTQGDEDMAQFPEISDHELDSDILTTELSTVSRGKISQLEARRRLSLKAPGHWRKMSLIRRQDASNASDSDYVPTNNNGIDKGKSTSKKGHGLFSSSIDQSRNKQPQIQQDNDFDHEMHDAAWIKKVEDQEYKKQLDRLGRAQELHYSRMNHKIIWGKIRKKDPSLPPERDYDEETGKLIVKHWDGSKAEIGVRESRVEDENRLKNKKKKHGKKHVRIKGSKRHLQDGVLTETENNGLPNNETTKDSLVLSKSESHDTTSHIDEKTGISLHRQEEDQKELDEKEGIKESTISLGNSNPEPQSERTSGEGSSITPLVPPPAAAALRTPIRNSQFLGDNQDSIKYYPYNSSQAPSISEVNTGGSLSQLPEHHFTPSYHHAQTFNEPEQRKTSLASLYNNYMELENVQGFVGLAALALAEVPSPKTLLKKGRWKRKQDDEGGFYDDLIASDNEGGDQAHHHLYEPTAAAGVKFKREHTRSEIMHRRLKDTGYLVAEYSRLGLRYFFTLKGFIVAVYFMLIVAFGGMLFLLLCNAAPAMSRKYGPDDKLHSPRQIWLEIDSQVLTALFCVTGLGLFPVRCRDFYYYAVGRWRNDSYYWVKVTKYHNNWFLPGYSKDWKLLTVVLLYIMNSLFQVLLCFVMWHYNRFTRPSWTTGTLIAASFSCVIVAGIIMFAEAKRVKTLYIISNGREGALVAKSGKTEEDEELNV